MTRKEWQMAGTKEATSKAKPPNGDKAARAGSSGSGTTNLHQLLAFTFDPDAGQIIKVEKIDSSGARQELSAEDRAQWAADRPETLEMVIEQAFEAGIACVLGDESGCETEPESREETDARRSLLEPLMERTSARGLLQRSVLGRVMLATALQETAASPAESPPSGPAYQSSSGPQPAASS
jgi:hypothetical protein